MIIEVVGKEIEKIKGDFESYLNGLNMVGEISYSQYSELYDEGTKQIQKAYELGKAEKNTDLENKIADIKANCDLAIEGRDVKIKELELELTVEKDQHQEEINLHLHAEDYIKSLEQKLEQTEKDLADYQFNYPTIKELSKENAELKELLNCNNCSELSEEECEVCAEYSHFKCKRKDLLTKAKDLLKKMYYLYFDPCVTHKDLENRDKLFEEVKQFIKE